MRRMLVVIVLLLCLSIASQAQDDVIACWSWECPTTSFHTEWLSAELSCNEVIHITVHDSEVEVVEAVPYGPGEFRRWNVGSVPASFSARFAMDGDYVQFWVFVAGHWEWVGLIDLVKVEECVTPEPPQEAMVECLGISLDWLIAATGYVPETNVFEIDNVLYEFRPDNISFIVPESAIWTWRMYVDERHLLTFEQSEDAACAITEVYPQD